MISVAAGNASTEVNGFTAAGIYEFEVTARDGTDSVTDMFGVEGVGDSSTTSPPPGNGDDGGCGRTINEGTNGTAWLIVLLGAIPFVLRKIAASRITN